ncbi:MAG: glycine cleavage system protein H [Dehalococcoidaceae bacterium]|nr:glycine cleavage system protein H [Dehalococcoidaceae bacterium]
MAEKTVLYTDQHLWIETRDEKHCRVGVTHFYLDKLASIRIAEISPAGSRLKQEDTLATLESSKAAVDLPSPVSGRVSLVNTAVIQDPGLINRDPMGEGWLAEIELDQTEELKSLLSDEAYQKMVLG